MARLTREEQIDRERFEEVMAAHVARLMDFAKPYIGRLNGADRESFLNDALESAWNTRRNFNPQRASLLRWWENCLRYAALGRKEWTLYYENDISFVAGCELGRRR